MLEPRRRFNPSPMRAAGKRVPRPMPMRPARVAVHALAPSARIQRVFWNHLAPLGCKIEFGPSEEGGVFITLASVDLSDYGRTLEDAIQNFVERAREVAAMRKAPGETWTKGLEAQHRLLKKALA